MCTSLFESSFVYNFLKFDVFLIKLAWVTLYNIPSWRLAGTSKPTDKHYKIGFVAISTVVVLYVFGKTLLFWHYIDTLI